MLERPLPKVHVLHEYLVEVRRVQFTSVYVLARNSEEAEEKADTLYHGGELVDWDDAEVEVWNVEETT